MHFSAATHLKFINLDLFPWFIMLHRMLAVVWQAAVRSARTASCAAELGRPAATTPAHHRPNIIERKDLVKTVKNIFIIVFVFFDDQP